MKGWMFFFTIAFVMTGCSGGGGGPSGDKATVTGRVWLGSLGGEPADSVTVEAWLDADGNGQIDTNEKSMQSTSDEGRFSLQAPAGGKRPTLLAFSRDGYTRQLKTVCLQSASTVELQVVLYEAAALDCQGTFCQDASASVRISGIEAADGQARVFNPAVEADAFPGEFRDDEGKMLISSVFGLFELLDADDKPITNLPAGQKARMEMRLPRDTWGTLRDLSPGDDRIQIPMYYFDEAQGEWRAEGEGWLESAAGELLAEARLAEIHDGSLPGDIYAVAEVGHFSYWNVDWPQSDNGSCTFRVVDEKDQPVTGAACYVIGENFSGMSAPLASGTGSECTNLRRSEAAGEDLDGNGIEAEVLSARVVCLWKEKFYRFPPFDIPAQGSSCPAGLDLGVLKLDETSEVPLSVCTLRGVVLQNGLPQAGAMVSVEDSAVPRETADALCGGYCQSTGISGDDGTFEVTTAMASGLKLDVLHTLSEENLLVMLQGHRQFRDCPTGSVPVHLSVSNCQASLPVVQADKSSGAIDWQPATLAAEILSVISSSSGMAKWQIYSTTGFLPPLVFGQVPAGASQVFPTNGSPTPLAAGDNILVIPRGGYVTVFGYRCPSVGTFEVP